MKNSKAKILHLVPEINITCGVTKTIYLICKNITEFEHYVIGLSGDAFKIFVENRINVINLNKNYKNPFSVIYIIIYLIYFVKKTNIGIIHSHHRFFDLVAFLISKVIQCKTITNVQSYVIGKKSLSYKADKLIAVSKFIQRHLIDYFKVNPERIKLIYNFVNPDDFVLNESIEKLKTKYNIPYEKFLFVFIGRFHYEKGVDFLLKAFYRLQKSNNNVFLLLVGTGIEKNNILNFIRKKDLNAKVLEPVTEIKEIYAIADVIVLPSRIDPFPLTILESGIMKKPLIASSVGGIPEVIKDKETGLLIEKNNIDDLYNKMELLFFDKKLREYLAENLYNRVKKEFIVETIILKYSKLY